VVRDDEDEVGGALSGGAKQKGGGSGGGGGRRSKATPRSRYVSRIQAIFQAVLNSNVSDSALTFKV
jgi:hypothetical protein